MHLLRPLGPAATRSSPIESLRAGLGAFVGLGLTGIFVLSATVDLKLGLFLIAPFGASSVLLFAVPNSPLAQPWAAIVGNTLAALIGVAVSESVGDPTLRIPLAVGLTITVMILFRAAHPPAGAVAMTAAMSPDAVSHLGYWFALTPVAAGTVTLVAIAAIYARLTGREYPFRQLSDPNKHGTEDPDPTERLGLSEAELNWLLERNSQSLNLGTEDLARLIGAAELQAATHRTGPLTASDIMSRDLVTVEPSTPLAEVAHLFDLHKFLSLPVVNPDRRFLGIIFQLDIINRARDDGLRLDIGLGAAMGRLADKENQAQDCAEAIMNSAWPHANAKTPIAELLPLMADGDIHAVPVLEGGHILGIVTHTDLISALVRDRQRGGALRAQIQS